LKKIVINNITKPCSANTLKSEVNLKSLSRYELGSSVPPADALKAIADALD
jgi:transcriptional regulator with XRE-family HTH domain